MERLFSVGQLMPCYVQAIKGTLANLSVKPYLVNSHLLAKDIKPKLVGCDLGLEIFSSVVFIVFLIYLFLFLCDFDYSDAMYRRVQ